MLHLDSSVNSDTKICLIVIFQNHVHGKVFRVSQRLGVLWLIGLCWSCGRLCVTSLLILIYSPNPLVLFSGAEVVIVAE